MPYDESEQRVLMVLPQRILVNKKLSLFPALLFAILLNIHANMLNGQPQFTLRTERNKEFDDSCLVGTAHVESGGIADCFERCLENCRCQSFQICQNTKCQLCSSHKDDNSSLLHENNDCVYVMYDMKEVHHEENFQNMAEQCSSISCFTKYNCCQEQGICSENKLCKPMQSLSQPWKRFTCECPNGYHGDNCEKLLITSCKGYQNRSLKSGIYKVLDSNMLLYNVYCHFDSNTRWTLVQSHSFENSSKLLQFTGPVSEDHPVNELVPIWSGYRLSKARMQTIYSQSDFLLFTCDYEKEQDKEELDYYRVGLRNIINYDIFHPPSLISDIISTHIGKINGKILNSCYTFLSQSKYWTLYVYFSKSCQPLESNNCTGYFGSYGNTGACLGGIYRCVESENSTTQLWFGSSLP
ncbi:uncharacterized protein LOC114526154 isoform X2 [Dendronephthya gigantea]|uniref:uncharacterized protein LOC114526154 isoform X2 n=1 Tax=Dendronephthya gigantea TaxID=151771 RepID=UPI00106AB005|nr:uncharacterized protein LOC114526154 isoform X2 [Dendronephthya gigantea]